MEKPILVARAELMQDLAGTINRSGMPLIIVEPLLENLLAEVRTKIQQQYEREKAEYEAATAKEQEEKHGNSSCKESGSVQ